MRNPTLGRDEETNQDHKTLILALSHSGLMEFHGDLIWQKSDSRTGVKDTGYMEGLQ